MHLSVLPLNLRSKAVQRDLADRKDLHRTTMSLFPWLQAAAARQVGKILFRCDDTGDEVRVLLQSSDPPSFEALPPNYLLHTPQTKDLRPFLASLSTSEVLRFKLEANVSKRDVRTGRRVELSGGDDLTEWLVRRGERFGFRIHRESDVAALDVAVSSPAKIIGGLDRRENQKERVTLGAALFEGRLRVIDPGRLVEAVSNGVGPGKAFGLGLLSLGREHTE